ncbi:hypothetical protein O0L34_g17768 [Tuta absoluta]|nr:hypothetical protein O0L34_g17768 [Tuta absoluta]
MSWKFFLMSFMAVSARNIKRGADYYTETIYISSNVRRLEPFITFVEPNAEVKNFDRYRRIDSSSHQHARDNNDKINPQYDLDQSQQSNGHVEPRHIHPQNYQNNFQINNDFLTISRQEGPRDKQEENVKESNTKRQDQINLTREKQQTDQGNRGFIENQPKSVRSDYIQRTDQNDAIIFGQGQENTRHDDNQDSKHRSNKYNDDDLSKQNSEGNRRTDVTQYNNRKSVDNRDSILRNTKYNDNQEHLNINTNLNQNRQTNTRDDTSDHRDGISNINDRTVIQGNRYNNDRRTINNEAIPDNRERGREETYTHNNNQERTNNNRESTSNNRSITNYNKGTNNDEESLGHNADSANNNRDPSDTRDTNYNGERTYHNAGQPNVQLPSENHQGHQGPQGHQKGSAVTTDKNFTPDVGDRAAFTGDGCPVGKVKVHDKCVDPD